MPVGALIVVSDDEDSQSDGYFSKIILEVKYKQCIYQDTSLEIWQHGRLLEGGEFRRSRQSRENRCVVGQRTDGLGCRSKSSTMFCKNRNRDIIERSTPDYGIRRHSPSNERLSKAPTIQVATKFWCICGCYVWDAPIYLRFSDGPSKIPWIHVERFSPDLK